MKTNKMIIITFLLNIFLMSAIGMSKSRDFRDSTIILPAIFSDNMVLQQGREIPIWGWSEPGTYVRVALNNPRFSASASADKTGKWLVRSRFRGNDVIPAKAGTTPAVLIP